VTDKEELFAKIDPKLISRIEVEENEKWKIDVRDLYYRDLNALLRSINDSGVKRIELRNVFGQRYIGTDLAAKMEIDIHGTPGNDLGAFLDGPKITVHGNAQDGCGNTMNNGTIIVHGHAGDITSYSMRGGKIFIRDDVGYRAGIHMKEYQEKKPCLVIGGTAQDFLGEYMAGGILVVLGLTLKNDRRHKARFVGTGMHGGIIYIRGEAAHLGKEVGIVDIDKNDKHLLSTLVREFCGYFKLEPNDILDEEFMKLAPVSHRPYGSLYAY
jgi:glutamate synthase domain-containing protein 3